MKREGRTLSLSFLVLVLLLAFALRAYRLGYQSFWYDEAYSFDLAQRNFAEMAKLAAGDQHPPLYYLLLKGWATLTGGSEFSLRYLSLLLGLLVVPTGYVLASRLFGPRTGVIMALLAAGSPFFVYYSQETRMYTLMCLFATLAVYFFLRAATSMQARYWVGYVICATVGLYSHLYVSLILAFLNLAYLAFTLPHFRTRLPWSGTSGRRLEELSQVKRLACRQRRWTLGLVVALRERGLSGYLLSQFAVAVLYLPWLSVALERFANFSSPGHGGPLDWILTQTVTAFSLGYNILSIGAYPGGPGYAQDAQFALALSAPFLALAVLGARLVFLRRDQLTQTSRATKLFSTVRSRAVFAVAYLLVPMFLIMVLSAGKRDFGVRYLFAASPAYLLLVALGIVVLGERRLGWLFQGLALLVIGGVWFFSLHNYYFEEKYSRDDQRSAVAFIREYAMPGDLVVLDAPFDPVYQYYAGDEFPWLRVPDIVPTDHRASLETLAAALPKYRRIWLVMWNDYYADPQRVVQHWLDANTFRIAEAAFHGPVIVHGYLTQSPVLMAPPQRAVSLKEDLGGKIELMGYDLQVDESRPRRRLHLTFYWQAIQRMNTNYSIFAHLLSPAGQTVGIGDSQPVYGHLPTTVWEPGQIIRSEMDLWPESGLAPGDYRLIAGAYDPITMERLAVGNSTFAELQSVRFERRTTDVKELDLGDPSSVHFGNDLTLIGRKIAQPAKDLIRVTLFWRAERPPAARYKTFNHLVDVSGQIVAQRDGETGGGFYPTNSWQPGEIVRDEYEIVVPAGLAGRYRLLTGLYQPETGERLSIIPNWPFGSSGMFYQTGEVQLER